MCVCSSFYALSPRSGGTHTHGAQHAIWLPCTRRSTRCGSFSMPISCRAYWMNRAPCETHRQRPDTQPKPQLSFRSAAATATAAFAATAAEVLFASLWRLAFWILRNSFPASSSIVPLSGSHMNFGMKLHGWWHIFCIHNATFSRNKCGSCACALDCFAPWCSRKSKKREMQSRKLKDKRLKEIASNISVIHSIDTRWCQSQSEEIQ